MPAPDFLTDAWLAVVQLSAERYAAGKDNKDLRRIAQQLRDYIETWPPKPTREDRTRAALLEFDQRQQ